jgi:NAD(P)-dependent dehydrogenase (short-subunit alcohol dehydrogenase family)
MQHSNVPSKRTALVTGATSGLGYSAAKQLAESGYRSIIITGRTVERANEARTRLEAETGLGVFDTVPLDLNQPASVAAAAAQLAEGGATLDVAILNAGMVSGSELTRTDEDIEITMASSLVGHHQLTMQLLADRVLSPDARILIAGSEAARGDVPTFAVTDIHALASKHFDGDLVTAAEAIMRSGEPVKYKPANAYADAKQFVAWWAASLARRLPAGMTINAVSPGSAPDTDAARNANFFMRNVMLRVFKFAPGMSAPTDVAARRYLDAAQFGPEVNGLFFASAPKKMIGELHRQQQPHILDVRAQEAAWEALVRVSGGIDYPVSA